jgi:L-2-hydroxyglutarate oxidase
VKARYLALCRRYCPELTLADLSPYRSGVRAQAVLADGTMVHDFLIGETARTIHVLNAPSPAATSSIPIGRHITRLAEEKFVWKAA